MSEPTKIKWQMAGEEVGNCNCSWGCPCQFNALPTTGHCEALLARQVSDGYFGRHPIGRFAFRSPFLVAGTDTGKGFVTTKGRTSPYHRGRSFHLMPGISHLPLLSRH